ncbi:hypothetical protein VTJ83DRAFT_7533 [Remersonia thermophila]|uniref:SMP domain-containing protein n=1 Tax=Remersonia thermophila TaxID=72144 RepID=A0ABR4D3W2_9PEZI
MNKDDAARIQAAQAKGGKDVGAGSFPARAQSAADKNANANKQPTNNSEKPK